MALIHITIEKVVIESDPEIKDLLLEIKEIVGSNDQPIVDAMANKIKESTDKLVVAVSENTPKVF